ncbi:Cytochrome c oxidase assembly factor 3, mitochondrial [Candida viswanathii]|uniref:Cytochrome c oxidase assembly factor 3 n=1 Tax=Candida viswanathii TaxID=5486 RepID=A0A367YE96_9ASCO|nr:Cytochrome c oxidase assembly factor 3, mitochondrial [Candida viswanathii]
MGKVIGAPKRHVRYRDPVTQEMTPALYRLRAPFFWKNTMALFVVGSIPLAIYWYSFKKIGGDDFSDIPIPPISDEELEKLKLEYESKNKN